MSQWYYMRDGRKYGPVDTAALKRLAHEGALLPSDTIWREGLAEWVPASQAKGLFVAPTHVADSPQLTTGPTADWRALALAASAGVTVCALVGLVVLMLFWPREPKGAASLSSGQSTVNAESRVRQPSPAPVQVASATTRLIVSPQSTPPVNAPQPDESPAELFRRLAPAVVRVMAHSADGKPGSQGSGFFLSADGLLVTNFHVISDADEVEIFLDNNARFPLEGVMAVSKDEDIAILKVDATNMPKLRLSQGELPFVGATVYAIGNPQGLVNTFSRGEVSGHREIIPGLSLIQCTTPISPGSSGGPLMGNNGEVVGMTTFYFAKGQNLNFAVPSPRIRALVDKPQRLKPLADATGRPKAVATPEPIDPPRWMKDLPYEARVRFVVSASPDIRGVIEGYFKRELRKISSVVLTDEKPQWQISVVALPDEVGNTVAGYWMSVVVFEIKEHWDPKNPFLTDTRGNIVKHELMMRGSRVLEDGVKQCVVGIEGELIEKDRGQYEALREFGRKWRKDEKDKRGDAGPVATQDVLNRQTLLPVNARVRAAVRYFQKLLMAATGQAAFLTPSMN